MSDEKVDATLIGQAQDAWLRYLELLDPIRPDLFRYCRRLTGNAWDAEDLIQDTIEQGFARLCMTSNGVDNARGYVLRIASNLWISRQRRERLARASSSDAHAEVLAPQGAPAPDRGSELRDAGAALLQLLAPQERAAVLLKDTFDLSLEEIADALGTSVGAVKAALHRGRERLRDVDQSEPSRPAVSRAVIDRFVEHYNKRDMPAMLALMLDSGTIDMPGIEFQVGRKVYGGDRSWFYHNFYSPFDGKPSQAKWETVVLAGELVVLVLQPHDGEMKVASVMRLETHEDRVSRIRVYAGCPDTVQEVAATLGRAYGGFPMYHLPRAIIARLKSLA